jgi:hypothetical protein
LRVEAEASSTLEPYAAIRRRTDFLNRADADPVGFAQGAVDGARFCHPHFSTVDKERDIGRVSIAVAYESTTFAKEYLR